MEIYRDFTFDAAHRLDRLPAEHKCSSMHGHTYKVRVYVEGTVKPETGWVMDYGELKRVCEPAVRMLDHKCLNDIEDIGHTTSENIAVWLWNRIAPDLPGLSMIEVKETPGTGCRYRG
ncbi:6-carboxytetrahydropterin synthase QueD [Candidatus Fermentibacteria bacterium]|nr:MAG: 6-carboxytetrahydropterin synthase QueD [Candidatus Fermentibacteria bacterium]PIE52288.1 MAG: 6-carboxytetrahydropterin synthase QueD [Candidatus Fermentibacteria bacterium]PIE52783.1 MAG: 6-carboxytetrahydropterin synthase QueD [Candidatus Fermentibacteria bacterium]